MVSLSRTRLAHAMRPSVPPLWAQPASNPATTAIANAAVQCAFFCGPLIVSLSMRLFGDSTRHGDGDGRRVIIVAGRALRLEGYQPLTPRTAPMQGGSLLPRHMTLRRLRR